MMMMTMIRRRRKEEMEEEEGAGSRSTENIHLLKAWFEQEGGYIVSHLEWSLVYLSYYHN